MASCKEDCEALMSAVLPVAEQMLSEHRALRPFGSTMSSAGDIAQLGGWNDCTSADTSALFTELEQGFRDGAGRGELRATALLCATRVTPPGATEPCDCVAVHLDHREDYSLVVSFPYRFTQAGELVIDEPFAAEGPHQIF